MSGDMRDPRRAGAAGPSGTTGLPGMPVGLDPSQLQGLASALGIGGVPAGAGQARDARDVRTQTGRDAARDGGAGQKLEAIDIHGEGRIAGDARQISPEGPGRTLVKAGERVAIHVHFCVHG